MRYSLEDLIRLSDARYQHDAGFVGLRGQMEARLQIRHKTYAVPGLPATVAKMINGNYKRPGKAAEKLDRGKAHIRDPQGILFSYAANGDTDKAKRMREDMAAWQNAAWQIVGLSQAMDKEDLLDEHLLLHSMCCVCVMPMPSAWAPQKGKGPSTESFRLPKGMVTIQEAARLANEYRSAQDKATADLLYHCRTHFPVSVQVVDPATVWFKRNPYGIEEVCEWRRMAIEEVLATYQDADGKPMARELERRVKAQRQDLTHDDEVTLFIRADDTHMQIAVIDTALDVLTGDRLSMHGGTGTAEFLYNDAHGLGRLPYVFGFGRMTPSSEPYQAYRGFLDPILEDEVELARVHTQRSFIIEVGAWPGVEIQKHESLAETAAYGDERPNAFKYQPGGVHDNLAAGETLVPIRWWEPSVLEPLNRREQQLLRDIDEKTFSAPAYGPTPGIDSGYQQNQVTAMNLAPLEPFKIGKATFYAEVALAIQRAAKWVIEQTGRPVEVRSVKSGKVSYVKLTPEMASEEWSVEANIQPEPPGGRLAWTQTIKTAEDAGYISHEEAMTLYGNRQPRQTMVRILADRLVTAPETQKMLVTLLNHRLADYLGNPSAPGMPGRAVLPPVFAQALRAVTGGTSAPLLSGGPVPDLPGAPAPGTPSLGPPGPVLPGLPGGPPTNAGLPAPASNITQPVGPAPFSPTRLPGAPQGNRAGQAQTLPGGLSRMAETLPR